MSEYNLKNPLYHGSRGGIKGTIKPVSRERCDFGPGFYMGTNPDQAKSLVANDPAPFFYRLHLDLLRIPESRRLELKDMDWAYFVLYNRGRLESAAGSGFYQKYQHLGDDKDIIIGPIADDAMNESMNRFLNNQITDKAFLESIRAINYGIQYVAKTAEACSHISILSETKLYGKELEDSILLSDRRRKEGRRIADQMQLKFRREGKYFDELLQEITV